MSDAAKSGVALEAQSSSTDIYQLDEAQLEQLAGGCDYHSLALEGFKPSQVESIAQEIANKHTMDAEATKIFVARFVDTWESSRQDYHRTKVLEFGGQRFAIMG